MASAACASSSPRTSSRGPCPRSRRPRPIAAGWRRRHRPTSWSTLPARRRRPGLRRRAARRPSAATCCRCRSPARSAAPASTRLSCSSATTAYVESAQACGLHLVPPRRATRGDDHATASASSSRAAVDAGRGGRGRASAGPAPTTRGAGMLAALGAVAVDSTAPATALPYGGAALRGAAPARRPAPEAVASSSSRPPTSTTRCSAFEVRRTASARRRVPPTPPCMQLDGRTRDLRPSVGRRGAARPRQPGDLPGAGAAGGLGYAPCSLLGAERVPGIATVLDAVDLADPDLPAADLVVTGEGAFDWQCLRGKVVPGWRRPPLAQRPGVRRAGRAGRRRPPRVPRRRGQRRVRGGRRPARRGLAPERPSPTRPSLAALAARAARTWSR